MPSRPAAASVTRTVNDLLSSISRLTSAVSDALASPKLRAAAVDVRDSAKSVARAAGPKAAKLKKALKAHWDAMTPKQRQERVKKMLAGRGVKPIPPEVKARRAASPRSKALKKAIAASWAKMTPEEHAERVRKMLAGRGLELKATASGA